jgi:hypothetical protein
MLLKQKAASDSHVMLSYAAKIKQFTSTHAPVSTRSRLLCTAATSSAALAAACSVTPPIAPFDCIVFIAIILWSIDLYKMMCFTTNKVKEDGEFPDTSPRPYTAVQRGSVGCLQFSAIQHPPHFSKHFVDATYFNLVA